MSRRSWIVLCTGAAMVFLTMGVRQSIGLFLKPVVADLDTDRESFALAVAAHNLVLGLPLAAMLADRVGPRRIVAAAGLVMGLGLVLAGQAGSMPVFGLSLAVVFGLAVSGSSFVVVIGAVGKAIPAGRQSFGFGLVTAGASIGMFAVVPISQELIDGVGWRSTLVVLGVAALVVIGAASRLLPADDVPATGWGPHDTVDAVAIVTESLRSTLTGAIRNRSYVLLVIGFFVCGFHVAFIASHLPAYLTDEGLDDRTAALALSLVGLFNVAGSLAAGWLGDRYRRRHLLAGLYFSRAVVMTVFLLVPLTATTAIVFGATMGLLWLSTVPLTSGLVAAIFGPRYLSTLFGFVFLSHQIGAFVGVWLGGRVYDTSGGYGPVWATAVVLGVAAALVHLPIARSTDHQAVAPAPA